MMNALVLCSHGLPDSAQYRRIERPTLQEGELLVKVHASTFNRVDLHMRASGARIKHVLPQVMGLDACGELASAPSAESKLCVGQDVVVYPLLFCGACRYCQAGDQPLCTSMRFIGEHCHGAMAEFVSVPEVNVLPLPAGLSHAEGACLPVAYLTAWRMVMGKAKVRAGETVVVIGVGGGVATAAMQFAKMAGARVIVTSSSNEKLGRARTLGAAAGIDYVGEDVVKRVKALTDGEGADVVINNVGGDTWGQSLRMAARGGRIVTCGVTAGDQPPADLRRVFIRQLEIHGSTLGSIGEFRQMLAAIGDNGIKPLIDRHYPLPLAASALDDFARSSHMGKIVVDVKAA